MMRVILPKFTISFGFSNLKPNFFKKKLILLRLKIISENLYEKRIKNQEVHNINMWIHEECKLYSMRMFIDGHYSTAYSCLKTLLDCIREIGKTSAAPILWSWNFEKKTLVEPIFYNFILWFWKWFWSNLDFLFYLRIIKFYFLGIRFFLNSRAIKFFHLPKNIQSNRIFNQNIFKLIFKTCIKT